MPVSMAASTLRLAGPVAIYANTTALPPPVSAGPAIKTIPLAPVGHLPPFVSSIPVLLSLNAPLYAPRKGSLFSDRFDNSLHWYLPDFSLLDGEDPAFSFVATQSGQDQDGRPFFSAEVCLTVRKSMPPDVLAFVAANPGAGLREIPLKGIAASLASQYTSDDGVVHQRAVAGIATDVGNGDFTLTFGPIMGPAVAAFYNDLVALGETWIGLAASFLAWSTDDRRVIYKAQVTDPRVRTLALATPLMMSVAPPPPARPSLGDMPWTDGMLAGLKYAQAAYQLKYATQVGAARQVIRDAGDLNNFAQGGSEFRELLALGALGERYPTISKAYVGSISRTIVVIPRHYAMLRTRSGCVASCTALVDSTPGSVSQCKFELDFTIAPQVSRVEMAQLAAEVAAVPELKGFSIKFPDFLGDAASCKLLSEFTGDVQFAAGPITHTFVISLAIHDQGPSLPAVAGVNLLIAQLCSTSGIGLAGKLAVRLDDLFPAPVTTAIALSFYDTVGSSDEILVSSDDASNEMKATSNSVMDLSISRYAATAAGIAIHDGPWPLPAGAQVLLDGSDATMQPSVIVETAAEVPRPFSKSAIANFLTIQTVDVQSLQYTIALDADAIDFTEVDSITASVVLVELPQLATPALHLMSNLRADSFHVPVPLQSAVFALPATVKLAVKWVDTNTADWSGTLQHDFSAEPVLVLDGAMLKTGGA